MKTLLSLVIMALYGGCLSTTSPFVQNDIRIVPPVTQEGYDGTSGIGKLTVFNDGGTQLVKIRDAEGKQFNVYIDHRINSRTLGAIYLRACPASRPLLTVAPIQIRAIISWDAAAGFFQFCNISLAGQCRFKPDTFAQAAPEGAA